MNQSTTAMATSNLDYQAIIKNAGMAILLCKPDGSIVSANKAGCKLFGYAENELKEKGNSGMVDLVPGLTNYSFEKTAAEPLKGEVTGITNSGQEVLLEFTSGTYSCETGEAITCYTFVDISGRKKSSNKLTETQAPAEASYKDVLKLINSTTDMMWSVDEELCLIVSNNSLIDFYKSMSGVSLTHGDTILPEGLLPAEFVQYWHTMYSRALNGESFKTKIKRKIVAGESEWFDVAFNPIVETGKVIGVLCCARNITESQQATENLKQTILRYTNVTKATSDAIWDWDLKSNNVYLGEKYQHLFGTQNDEATTSVEEVISLLHPEEKASLLKTAGITLKNGSLSWTDEHRFLKADGTYAVVSNKALIIRNEYGKATRVIGAMQDITRQKQEQHRLKLLESVVLNTKDAVVITEAEPFSEPGPKIIYVNEAFTKMTGYKLEEVIGKTPRLLQGPDSDKEELARLGRELREWKTAEITTLNYKKNGDTFWNQMSISPVANEQGWFTHWIAIERDVTEQKQLELKLQELNNNLQKQAKELALSNTELEQFAYVASHDLQEPLRMVSSFLNLLQTKYGQILDENGNSYIDIAVDGAKRMKQLITDLLEFSKVGRMNEMPEQVNPARLIENIKMLFMKRIRETDAQITVGALPDLLTHKTPMHQVFHNIIGNALKYTAPERAAKINISGFETDTHWQFSIADNGIGVDPIHFEKIFVIFQRLHKKEQYSGTGMGLAVTKKIIENLGGEIWLESELGSGTTFHFTIAKPVANQLT